MRGAIAAGHPLTAEAGARILADGGNAVDACVAAAFASWVAESPLTGPGAGGFMLVHRARDRTDRLLDFFVAVPGLGARAARAPRHDLDRHRLRRRLDPGLPDRRRLVRGARRRCRPGGRVPRLRLAPVGAAVRAGARARSGRRRADASAGVPARDPRPDPPAHRRGAAHLRPPVTPRSRATGSCSTTSGRRSRSSRGRAPPRSTAARSGGRSSGTCGPRAAR